MACEKTLAFGGFASFCKPHFVTGMQTVLVVLEADREGKRRQLHVYGMVDVFPDYYTTTTTAIATVTTTTTTTTTTTEFRHN